MLPVFYYKDKNNNMYRICGNNIYSYNASSFPRAIMEMVESGDLIKMTDDEVAKYLLRE